MEDSRNGTVTRQPNRPSGRNRVTRSNNGRFAGDATWYACDQEELADFVSRATSRGACCIFSVSTDGGVLSLTVIYGNERWRAFPRSGDDAILAFRDILADIDP